MKVKICGMMASVLLSAMSLSSGEPDVVSLFSYANPDGGGGLKLAWSVDGKNWKPLMNGGSVVNSDFGPWGLMKRMYNPRLTRLMLDGTWQCVWDLSKDGDGMGYATSPDLTVWSPQQYFTRSRLGDYLKTDTCKTVRTTAAIDGKQYTGYSQQVPFALIKTLRTHGDARAHRDALNNQVMAGDRARFAGLAPVGAKLKVYGDSTKEISDELIGIFFEDINYSADGGLYAELIRNRDFEYSHDDHPEWTPATAWSSTGADGKPVEIAIATESPIHVNNPHYASVSDATLTNVGFDGITLHKGEDYRLSLFARGKATLKIELLDSDGGVAAMTSIKVSCGKWKKLKKTLTADADVKDGSLRITVEGRCDLDMVSLFPANTFRGRENGLRRDLARTLADLKPRFVRFPGGCVAHGDGVDNIYDWKGSIGELEARKPLRNLWGYHQTRGLGYHEYFLFCEDIGATPLPVVAAGVPCQNSGTPSHHSHDEVSSYGQQCGIPMEEMDDYIQDVLDLIEYANGDPKKSEWGRRRAQAGHPAPFNLKYIGIGNEDMITEVFEERFRMISDAVKARHPEVEIVGTVGPFYEGTDYERGWEFATEEKIPIVDEHYYVSPGWLIHNNDYYDNYDRTKPAVYLGEYASHLPGRPSNIETALSVALYLTGMERNADIVRLTSYAPLLANKNHTQWNPDLIYFDNDGVMPTVDYHVQKLYGNNSGDRYVASELTLDNGDSEVRCRVGASVVRDSKTGRDILKLTNLLPVEVTVTLEDFTIPEGAKVTVLTGLPDDSEAVPFTLTATAADSITLPAYSFTVVK